MASTYRHRRKDHTNRPLSVGVSNAMAQTALGWRSRSRPHPVVVLLHGVPHTAVTAVRDRTVAATHRLNPAGWPWLAAAWAGSPR